MFVKMIRSITLLFLMIALISCNTTENEFSSKPAPNPFSEAPYIDGMITSIITNTENGSIEKILIEENPGKLNTGNKIHFSLTELTDILHQRKDGSLKPIDKEDLKEKRRVRGWSSGFIMDSYPAQGEAKRIVVIEK